MPDWDSDVLCKAESLENPRPLWSLPFSAIYLLWSKVMQSQTWLSEQGLWEKNQLHTYSSLSGLQVKTFTVLILWCSPAWQCCHASTVGKWRATLPSSTHYPKISSAFLYTQGSNRAEQWIPLKMREHPRMLSSTTLQSCRICVSQVLPRFHVRMPSSACGPHACTCYPHSQHMLLLFSTG